MCVAVLKPEKSTIDDSTIRKCWETNPDGGGLMYVNNGKIIVKKELENVESFIKKYHESLPFFQSDVILHFRIGTSGLMNLENTHPHKVNENVYMVHNGIIDRCTEVNSKFSDTMKFCKFISHLPNDFMKNNSLMELITGYIETDKMIFLDDLGNTRIINESLGKWVNGNWYSNTHWQYTKQFFSFNGVNYQTKKEQTKKFDLEDDVEAVYFCIDCDSPIGKYECHDYEGYCYSCFQLRLETERYYSGR